MKWIILSGDIKETKKQTQQRSLEEAGNYENMKL